MYVVRLLLQISYIILIKRAVEKEVFVQDDRLRSSVVSSENVIGSDQPVIIDTNVHHFMNGKRGVTYQ